MNVREAYRERVFPLLSAALWAVFLTLDVTGIADATGVKFLAICLCCVTAWTGSGNRDGALVAAALCFTVAADWFLLVRDDCYVLGICLFLVVQLLYAYRLSRLRGAGSRRFLARLALSALAVGLSLFPFWCAAVYFCNLCANCLEAFALGKSQRRFAIGLLLFVCCDVCVGCWNLGLLGEFARVGMWFFYLPSQVLIVLSQQEMRSFDEKAV